MAPKPKHPKPLLHAAAATLIAGLKYWDAVRALEQSMGEDVEVSHDTVDDFMGHLNRPEDVSLADAAELLDALTGPPPQWRRPLGG